MTPLGRPRGIRIFVGMSLGLAVSCSPVSAADSGTPDAGMDGGVPDGGPSDAGRPDGGAPDAGGADAGNPDAGTPDSGAPDAGSGDAGPDAGPGPEASYSYPGCEDAGSYGCPNSLVLTCALKAIQAKYSSCTTAADCVAASATNCIDTLTFCPPAAVNDASAFLAEANAEGDRYCTGGTCHISGLCAYSYQAGLTDCINGTCVAVPDDAGP